MRAYHQRNEYRVSLIYPSGTRTSRKFSGLTAAIKYANKKLDTTIANVVIERRECQPWVEVPLPIPENRKWNR